MCNVKLRALRSQLESVRGDISLRRPCSHTVITMMMEMMQLEMLMMQTDDGNAGDVEKDGDERLAKNDDNDADDYGDRCWCPEKISICLIDVCFAS